MLQLGFFVGNMFVLVVLYGMRAAAIKKTHQSEHKPLPPCVLGTVFFLGTALVFWEPAAGYVCCLLAGLVVCFRGLELMPHYLLPTGRHGIRSVAVSCVLIGLSAILLLTWRP